MCFVDPATNHLDNIPNLDVRHNFDITYNLVLKHGTLENQLMLNMNIIELQLHESFSSVPCLIASLYFMVSSLV